MAHEIEIQASGAPEIGDVFDVVGQLKLPHCNRDGTNGLKTASQLGDGLQKVAFCCGTKLPRFKIPDLTIILACLPLALSSQLPLPPHG